MGDPRKRVRDVGKRDPGGEGPKEKARPEARQDAASSLRSPAPPGRAEGGGGGRGGPGGRGPRPGPARPALRGGMMYVLRLHRKKMRAGKKNACR